MPSHLEVRSEEFHDIMQRTPKWITRWGITILLVIVVLILTGTHFIHYPDIVETNIWVLSKEKPVPINREADIEISQVLVKDKVLVHAGQPLFLCAKQINKQFVEVIKAPITGIFYLKSIPENIEIQKDKIEIGFIIPKNQQHLVNGKLPIEGIGKVEIGHKVILKLDAFPYREFGVIEGSVQTISPSIEDNTYDVAINLTNGLQTQNGKKITLPMKLKGKAEILTNEKSLLKRIFDII
ncbi:HlyD family secretion protein [Arcicella aurantiaca]|uniref:HlyD family secretion protein n=1 Tax=Arcicella aurantiaca TaxID=591202 RepID=A0A316DLG8_9BACT|nr:HlyD family efflux transporter periplasmic adaptor subunit [Arcicella aurantiaca]PWK18069.1 HlyD family secretion protein [Arcicella aurantiaca]